MTATGVRLSWRPIAADDVATWQELRAAAEAVDATGEYFDADDLREELADPGLDAERDTMAAFAGPRMVAYGLVHGLITVRGVYQVQAEGCVHPAYRRTGLGREVLRRSAQRAAELHNERHPDLPGELMVYLHDGNAGAAALATAQGMRPVRYWYDMQRDLAQPLPPVRMPDGMRLVSYQAPMDEALRQARNEAFADHWGSVERDQASWRQWFTGSRSFRPAVSFALLDGEEIAGLLLSYEFEANNSATGVREAWIGQVGTRPRWRGRGVASALLGTALAEFVEAGYQRAALQVDTGNPTGALGLYERAGFVALQRWTTHIRPL